MNAQNRNLQLLRDELKRRGFFVRTPLRLMGELLLFVLLTLAGIVLVVMSEELVWKATGMLIVAWASLAVSTNAHTASHGAISNNHGINKALVLFGYPFFLQVSASFWHEKHIVVHHRHPNISGIDWDADLTPFFALNRDDLQSAKGLHGWWYRHQGLFFPLVLPANAFGVVLRGWFFLLRKLIADKGRGGRYWLDLSMLFLHWVAWIILPMLYFEPINVLEFTLTRFVLISYGMFAVFAPAHYPAEAVLLDERLRDNDFALLQTVTAVNFRTGWIGRLLCGGVEYQIEHHLFPSISPAHYPTLAPIVEGFCREQGYPYRTLGWGESLWKSIRTFYAPKPVHQTIPAITGDARPARAPQTGAVERDPTMS